jgi:hypothetical protein
MKTSQNGHQSIFALLGIGLPIALVTVLLSITFHSTAAPSPDNSNPPVHWNPDKVNVIVARGGETNVVVTINTLKALGHVSVAPVPEFAAYVTVSPTVITNLIAGESFQLNLQFNVAAGAPLGAYDGTVQVREIVSRKGKGRVFPRLLPVSIIIKEANETIGSSDTNTNGVWDYVDQYIDTTYPGIENQGVRSAGRQFARAIQGGLLNAENKGLSIQYASASMRATECMYSRRPQDSREILENLEAVILNTKLRSQAFVMFNDQLSGQVFRSRSISEGSSSCVED